MRKALLIIGLAALACGSQETSTSTGAGEGATGAAGGETPAVSAVQPPSEATTPEEIAEPVDAVEVTTCVELVGAGKYADAIVACQTAVNLYPDNAKAAAALAKATAQSAGEGAAGAASAAAGEAAKEGLTP
jgi:hypothetical protein